MTLPSLISKHQRTVIETGLKKAYATVTNAIKLSEIDNGPYSGWNEKDMDAYTLWDVYLKPYFKDAVICDKLQDCYGYKNINYKTWNGLGDWNIITDSGRLTFQLPDGTVIFWMKHDATTESNLHTRFILIDANGAKGPNKGGIDVFRFERDLTNGKITAPKGDCAASVMYCTYDIMTNNWKFPANYPW